MGSVLVPCLLIGALVLLSGVVGSSLAQEATPVTDTPVLAPEEPVSGASLADWSARQWQWTASLPIPVNPGHDVTGRPVATASPVRCSSSRGTFRPASYRSV
jgi:hypothetical protein